MKYLMDLAYSFALIAFAPKMIYRMLRFNRYRNGWGQRLGNVKRERLDKKCIWIHAVSVGEVNATRTLVAAFKESYRGYEIVMSTTTDTGFARANALYGHELTIFYYPYDFSWVVENAFRNIQPNLCVLMELEVWPNFTDVARRENIPVVVANGRLSQRSFPRYKLIKPFVRRMFENVSLFLVQTQEYADRFLALGARPERVQVTGSLKYDTAEIADSIAGSDVVASRLGIGPEPLWVAGGTGPGEEMMILNVYRELLREGPQKDLRLAIVPRKPERFDQVAELIKTMGFDLVRYAPLKACGNGNPIDKTAVILVDTMGDLRKFYDLASLVFVGRSLVRMGGSDMIEAAALEKCTMFGPHTFNFTQDAQMLLAAGGAIMVRHSEHLQEKMLKCLRDRKFAAEVAKRGRQVISSNQGATARTVEAIAALVGENID